MDCIFLLEDLQAKGNSQIFMNQKNHLGSLFTMQIPGPQQQKGTFSGSVKEPRRQSI